MPTTPSFGSPLSRLLRTNPKRDDEPRYGYRYMYYAVVRLMRPKVVVEIGNHDGLGSAVLLRALERNAVEGDEGVLLMFDEGEASAGSQQAPRRDAASASSATPLALLGPALEEWGCDFLIEDIGEGFEGKRQLIDEALRHGSRRMVVASSIAAASAAPIRSPCCRRCQSAWVADMAKSTSSRSTTSGRATASPWRRSTASAEALGQLLGAQHSQLAIGVGAHRGAGRLDLAVADDQHVWHLRQLGVTDLAPD